MWLRNIFPICKPFNLIRLSCLIFSLDIALKSDTAIKMNLKKFVMVKRKAHSALFVDIKCNGVKRKIERLERMQIISLCSIYFTWSNTLENSSSTECTSHDWYKTSRSIDFIAG